MNIVQISTADYGGGAERTARELYYGQRVVGNRVWLAVGKRQAGDPDVIEIPDLRYSSTWARGCLALRRVLGPAEHAGKRGMWRLRELLRIIARPLNSLYQYLGVEDFDFPGTHTLETLTPTRADIYHLHNLHGGYFDLRFLRKLSNHASTIVTMHDAWLTSGHCAHSLGCERWRHGCGRCPDLTIYPEIKRDATAFNWRRKRDIFRASKLHVGVPCQWLRRKVEDSMLDPIDIRVIPYGVDLSIFCPGDARSARAKLGLPQSAYIILFVANRGRNNRFKDFSTLINAIHLISSQSLGAPVWFVCLGDDGEDEVLANGRIRYAGFHTDAETIVAHYRSADVVLHAANADTFPYVILEALACGTPVVATSVGGIPEQVEHGRTGCLVKQGHSEELACHVVMLLENDDLRQSMGNNAVSMARSRYDLRRMVSEYLDWYQELLSS